MAIPGQTPGESEYSWGPGMHPNPGTNYDPKGERSRFPQSDAVTYQDVANGKGTLEDQILWMRAEKRMNVNASGEEPDPTVAGNPDRFGPGLPLVRTKAFTQFPPPKLEPITTFKREE